MTISCASAEPGNTIQEMASAMVRPQPSCLAAERNSDTRHCRPKTGFPFSGSCGSQFVLYGSVVGLGVFWAGFEVFEAGFLLPFASPLRKSVHFAGSLNKAASGLSSLCDRHCQESWSVFVEENHLKAPRSERTLTLCARRFSRTPSNRIQLQYGTCFSRIWAPVLAEPSPRAWPPSVSLAVGSAASLSDCRICRGARRAWGRVAAG